MSVVKYDYYLKVGDLEPAIEANLQYADGTAVDVTDLPVTFKWRLRDDPSATVEQGSATIVDGPTGHVRHVWSSGNTDVAGAYYAQWEVEISPGRILTFPNKGFVEFLITEDL